VKQTAQNVDDAARELPDANMVTPLTAKSNPIFK